MKIAVTSQNRKSITEHAGRCRKFWVFVAENNKIVDKELLELPKDQAFHESSPHESHPLDDIDVLIAGQNATDVVEAAKEFKQAISDELFISAKSKDGQAYNRDEHYIKCWDAPVRYVNRKNAKITLPLNNLDFFIYQKNCSVCLTITPWYAAVKK